MDEQWLKKIQERVANHEQEPPKDLWDEIERSLDRTVLPSDKKKVSNMVVLPRRWHFVAAAIIAILLIITGSIIFFDVKLQDEVHENYVSVPSYSDRVNSENVFAKINKDKPDEKDQSIESSEMVASSATDNVRNKIDGRQIADNADLTVNDENITHPDTINVSQCADNNNVNEEKHKKTFAFGDRETNYNNTVNNTYRMREVNNNMKKSGKWNVGLYASNSISDNRTISNGYRNFKIGVNPFAVVPEKNNWSHDAMANIMLNNLNTTTTTDIKHHLPVRVGVSVNYDLTDRWGVESGLAYTILASDLRSGGTNDYYETKQKLHYLGIPLKTNFKIWSNKRFSVYAAAGGMMEIPVAGQSRTNYVNNGHVVGNDSEDVNPDKLQWSINANLGVQYNISNLLGIYLEPGVGYYFDDGSDVLTIYKEKKCNFDFQLGVRFNLNN